MRWSDLLSGPMATQVDSFWNHLLGGEMGLGPYGPHGPHSNIVDANWCKHGVWVVCFQRSSKANLRISKETWSVQILVYLVQIANWRVLEPKQWSSAPRQSNKSSPTSNLPQPIQRLHLISWIQPNVFWCLYKSEHSQPYCQPVTCIDKSPRILQVTIELKRV